MQSNLCARSLETIRPILVCESHSLRNKNGAGRSQHRIPIDNHSIIYRANYLAIQLHSSCSSSSWLFAPFYESFTHSNTTRIKSQQIRSTMKPFLLQYYQTDLLFLVSIRWVNILHSPLVSMNPYSHRKCGLGRQSWQMIH